jgi:hypothetical protein
MRRWSITHLILSDPFSHIPGLKHKIYKQQMDGYLEFMKEHVDQQNI